MPQDFPSQFGRSDQYRNPDGTLPMPSPENVPRPEWYGAHVVFRWDAGTVVGVNPQDVVPPGVEYQYTWTSPVFDLRPDLRSSQGGPKEGVPIWSSAARLYVQLFSPNNSLLPPAFPITTTAVEFAQVVKAQEQQRLLEGPGTPPLVVRIGSMDVTSKFSPTGSQESLLGGFSPPGTTLGFGDGYPIRYWRLKLQFSQYIETGLPIPDPFPSPYEGINLQAAVY